MNLYGIWPFSYLKKLTIALPLKLLSARDRLQLIVVVLVTVLLAILDLIGVLLIGVIGSLSISGVSNGQAGDRVSLVLQFLQLEKLSFEKQVVMIGLIAATILIAKTLFSLFLVRKSMFFLAMRAAVMSTSLISRYFTIPVSRINRRSAQVSIYALTSGVNSIMIGVIGVSIALISDIALLLILTNCICCFFKSAINPVTSFFEA